MKRAFLLSTGFSSLLCSCIINFGAIAIVHAETFTNFAVGDTFTIQTTTQLQGLTNDYFGYTETERDRRTYTVSDITEEAITWKVETDFSYSDNEGGNTSRQGNFTVKTHPETRAYLEGTFDGFPIDKDYNTYDFAWFYLPIIAQIPESSLQILGDTFTVAAPKTLEQAGSPAIEVIPVAQAEPSKRIVNNTEYDDDNEWTLETLTTNYAYDVESGFLVYGDWDATGYTDYGSFRWTATTTTSLTPAGTPAPVPPPTPSSPAPAPQPQNPKSLLEQLLALVAWVGGLGSSISGSVLLRRRSLRKHVERVINYAQSNEGDKSKIFTKSLSAWQANNITYQELLADIDPNNSLQFHTGMYVINDVGDRLGVVDIQNDKRLPSQLLSSEKRNLILLYRLALGIANANDTVKWEAEVDQAAPQDQPNLDKRRPSLDLTKVPETIQPYIYPSQGFAKPDPHSLAVYRKQKPLAHQKTTSEATQTLLARRKVLDYSLGQAPLSPASHDRKVAEILQSNPQQVLLVGDDDLVAISLARKGIEVCVLEIDPYTCALISHIATEEQLPITLYQHDLRRALPPELTTRFDLFVTDSDFTIESFFLFLNRGLSLLNPDGIGLINFENKGGQRFKAEYMLELLQVKVLKTTQEAWTYTIIQNVQVEVGRRQVGKSVHIDYRTDICLREAQYSSMMFRIQRTADTKIILSGDRDFAGDNASIYDYDDD